MKQIFIFYTVFLIYSHFKTCSAICLENGEYWKGNKCIPCTECKPPMIALATCDHFRDTQCGSPPYDEIGNFNPNSIASDSFTLPKEFKIEDYCSFIKNEQERRLCESKHGNVYDNNPDHSNKPLHDIDEHLSENDFSDYEMSEIEKPEGFMDQYSTKLAVVIIVSVFNLTLIFILLICCYKSCNKSKEPQIHRNCQKLPNPSNTPIKYRFTAVLPSCSQTQNTTDSPTSTLLRNKMPHHSNVNGSGTLSQNSTSYSRPDYALNEFPQTIHDSSLSLSRTNPHSTFHPREANHYYGGWKHPSQNSYVMDKLLADNRNHEGNAPMENNLYVESWCNSMQKDNTEQPFFSGFQLPSNNSNMMLRTYRES